MKIKLNTPKMKSLYRRFGLVLFALATGGISTWLPSASAAPAPPHGIVAANIDVGINDFDNTTNSVTFTIPYRTGDFRMVQAGSNNGDYDTQIGPVRTNDVLDGVMITSVRQNGRDDGYPILYVGTNFCTSHIDYHKIGATNDLGELIENSYFIPLSMVWPNANSTAVIEYDINVAAAWFPYDKWVGGFARNSGGTNGGTHNLFTGSAGLVLGTHYIDQGGGKAKLDLTSLGIDGRTDGVLLVMGAKNEDNYGLSWVNPTNGTWQLYSKDNGTDGASTEQDPLAFVFIPKTNTTVVSGRFQGDGTILLYSGATPQFTITPLDVGTWELKIPGKSPQFGVLIVSPEGGFAGNQDNMVTYDVNSAGDGWIIQSRDLPAPVAGPFVPPLETPGGGTNPVASFVFIPGPTPGITPTPTNGLATIESGGQVTFSVVLDTRPSADVTVNLSSSDTTEGTVAPSSLTFTPDNWETPQVVTVTGVDDGLVDGAISYSIILSPAVSSDPTYNDIDPSDITLINGDDESGGFTISPAGGLITSETNGQATFTMRLNTQPTGDVTVGLSSGDTTEGTVSPTSLIFTSSNWDQEQTVTITGVDDLVVDGNVGYTIITGSASSSDSNYSNLNPPDITVVNQDNDAAGVNIGAGPTGVQVVEGKTNSFTVTLNSQPTADVVVSFTSSDTAQGGTVSPASVIFTAATWNIAKTVTVTGSDDLIVDGDFAWIVTNSVSSVDSVYATLTPVTVSLTTLDNEAAITLPSGDLVYGIGQSGVGIDGRASISDLNATSYNSSTLTVTLTANGTSDDRLEIRSTGTDVDQISVSGNTISYGGTNVGTFTGGTGTTPLVVTFNDSASGAASQATLRNITFRNVSSNPSRNHRSVSVVLAHGDGGTSSATTGIRVSLVRLAQFQEATDHGYGTYTNAADIELFQSQPDTPLPTGHAADGNNPQLWLDYRDADNPNQSEALLRFDNIVGNNPGQIPSNAIIVSAELIFNIRDAGDGSPLYRMLIPWNEQTETWNSIGNGIQPDNIEARSTYESALGVPLVTGDSGIGLVPIGVTTDIQAWVNGETNYGWGLTGWNSEINPTWGNGTDGLGFSLCEHPNPDLRPRLRVLWVPAGTATNSYRQNVNGYISTRDTRVREDSPDAQAGTATSVLVDYSGSHDEVLIRFDDILGTSIGQIPPNSLIEAAILNLATVGGNGYGDGGQFFAMLSPWQDTDTWNTTVDGIQTDGVEAASTPTTSAGSASLSPNVCGGYMPFEVTSDVQAWSSGTRANYGWAILPWLNGGDGWVVSMSEAATENERPQLRVFYTPGVPSVTIQSITASPTSVTIQFGGEVGTTYSVRRAGTVDGTYGVIGTAVVQPNGVATFTDNAPLSSAAFYQVSNP